MKDKKYSRCMAVRKRPRDELDDLDESTSLVCRWAGCVDKFCNTDEYYAHVNSTHVAAKGRCCRDICGYVSKKPSNFINHVRTHTGEKPYKCDVEGCKFASATSSDLKVHMRTHTGEKPYTCDVKSCEKTFAQSQHLTNHMRTHTGEKPYKCDMEGCDKAFAQSQHLKVHTRTHTGEKPYKCDVDGCNYASAKLWHLQNHMRTHTGEKPYKCDVEGCEKAFADSSALKVHMRTHTGEKPYKCNVEGCDYACTTCDGLKRHMRAHTGEKPYKCDVEGCTQTFIQSSNLKVHKLRKHIGPWCVICGEHYVPDETMPCGFCNMNKQFGVKERRFFNFIHQYDERLAECCFTLRDQAMGCDVRKRPDGLLQLKSKAASVEIKAAMETVLQNDDDDCSVKLILEADEHQHASYNASCELARLQEIQDRDGDAIFVLRYNLDQPDGFSDEKLSEFCERILQVLDGDYVLALEVPLIRIEYFGYTEKRETMLNEEMARQLECQM